MTDIEVIHGGDGYIIKVGGVVRGRYASGEEIASHFALMIAEHDELRRELAATNKLIDAAWDDDWKSCGEISCDQCDERFAMAMRRIDERNDRITKLEALLEADRIFAGCLQERIDELKKRIADLESGMRHAISVLEEPAWSDRAFESRKAKREKVLDFLDYVLNSKGDE